jgi:hypothetical protein
MTHDVFVCHSSKDRMIANAIVARLEEHGIRCWIAPRDVVPGLEYAESIVEALARSTLTVLVFSANANSSPHVRRELERTASHGIPILPFRVEDVVPAPSVEYFISDAHWLDAMTPPMEQHLDHLVGTVRLLLDRQAAAAGVPVQAAVPSPAASGTVAVPTWTPPPVEDGPHSGATDDSGARSVDRRMLYAALAAVVLVGAVAALVLALNTPPSTEAVPSDARATEEQAVGGEAEETDASVIVEFDDGVGDGWTWENEDPLTWTVEDGALRIEVQQGPPIRNALLRDLPEGDAVVQARIDSDPSVPAHAAGLVLVGADLGDRVELCWTTEGLVLRTFEGEVMVDGIEIAPDQFAPGEWVGAELSFEITAGSYSAAFQSDTTPDWQIHTAPVPERMARVGLVAYTTQEAGGETAVFTRFVLQ